MYEGPDLFSPEKPRKIAPGIHVKDDDRHIALPAQCKGSLVHHFQMILKRLVESKFIISDG